MASSCFQQKRHSFASAAPSDSEDGDVPSVEEIIARAWRAPKKAAIDLTGDDTGDDTDDDTDDDDVVSWSRKQPGRLSITRS
jgi:hypothetical protein